MFTKFQFVTTSDKTHLCPFYNLHVYSIIRCIMKTINEFRLVGFCVLSMNPTRLKSCFDWEKAS